MSITQWPSRVKVTCDFIKWRRRQWKAKTFILILPGLTYFSHLTWAQSHDLIQHKQQKKPYLGSWISVSSSVPVLVTTHLCSLGLCYFGDEKMYLRVLVKLLSTWKSSPSTGTWQIFYCDSKHKYIKLCTFVQVRVLVFCTEPALYWPCLLYWWAGLYNGHVPTITEAQDTFHHVM